MAVDTFPIYEILVNNIFGSIGVAIIGIALVIALILFLTSSSGTFIAYWMIFYFTVMGTFYIGALGIILASMIGLALLVYNLIRLFGREG